MIYFIVLLLMLVAVYVFDIRRQERFYTFSYWGFFVILVLIAGLRYRIGTDSVVYENGYEDSPAFYQLENFKFNSTRFEPGFMVAMSLTRTFSAEFMWFQFFESIVINLVMFWFIQKNTRNRFLCVLLYAIVMYFNLNTQVLREAFAVAFFILAWPFFRDGKWIQYYILALLACCMHTSAFLLLILPLFCLPGIREIFVLGKRTIFICIGLLAIGLYIQANFTNVFSLMAVTERMVDRVHEYSRNEMGAAKYNIMGIIGTVAQFCIYPLIAIYFANQYWKYRRRQLKMKLSETEERVSKQEINRELRVEKKQEKKYDRWQMMVLLGVFFVIFSISMFIFSRYFNYFGIFCLATVSNWAFRPIIIKKKRIRLSPVYWGLVLLPYFFFNMYAYYAPVNKSGTLRSYQVFYPYASRLDPQTDTHREDIYRYLDAR